MDIIHARRFSKIYFSWDAFRRQENVDISDQTLKSSRPTVTIRNQLFFEVFWDRILFWCILLNSLLWRAMMRENSRKCAKNFKTKNHQLLFPFNTHPLTGTQYHISHHSLTTDLLSKRLFELCFSLLYFLLVTLYTVCNRPPPVTCSPPRNKFSELACSKGAHWTHEDSQYDNQLKVSTI